MNNIYKSKWSEATQTWVACSELVRGKTKNNCVKIAASVALALTSLGSYAADAPCNINTANSVIASGTETECSLSDGTTYTEISASGGATLTGEEGKTISATGTPRGKKVINVNGGSKLTATNITTTSKGNSADASALAIAGNDSKVTIDRNLEANSYGNSANVIANSDGSELNANGDIIIEDKSKNGFTNGIKNDNSKIVVGGNIKITSDIANSNSNSSIDNINGGRIEADNININQGDKNYAIHQTSENSSITVKNDLNITSGNIPEGNSAITIEGGDITVGGKTDITTHVDSEYIADPKNVSAISITNGKYTANGGADIKIKDDDEKDFTAAAGVILGNEGIFENNGTLTVNKDENTEGKNTVIATDTKSGEKATFTNNADGTTTSNVDTIVHNSAGTLIVKNHGDLKSNGGSVLKNDNTGTIEAVNDGILTGKIDNNSTGTIKLDNNVNPNRDPDNEEDDRGTVNSEITNRNTGTINITNNSTLKGSITNTGNASTVAANNIDITNNGVLNSTINNDGNGTIAINNSGKTDSSKKITNSKDGKINIINTAVGDFQSAIDNDATSTGMITLGNKGTVNSTITNKNTGAIKITNDNTLSGSITNTGYKVNKNDPDNIVIDNNHILKSTINNDGSGTIVVNNNEASSVINGDITNTQSGTITVNNKDSASTIAGNITNTKDGNIAINNSGKTDSSKKITNSNAGKINIINTESGSFESAIDNDATSTGMIILDNQGTVDSTITNQNTGAIKITNNGTLGGYITNTGNASTVAANNIDITNNNVLNSDINNDGKGTIALNNNGSVYSNITNTGDKIDENTANILIDNNKNLNGNINNDSNGSIVVNNNTASSVINGNITNAKDGNITLDNEGTFDGYIKNKGTGSFSLTNGNTVSGYIENNGTGRISLTNNGTINGSITNTGTKNNVDNIWINNNKDLNSTIENRDGSIVVNNNKEGSSFTGDIYNNTGEITVNNNKENTKINSHINNIHGGNITINNKAKTSTIEGDITNINGRVNIENSGEANYSKITNSGGNLNIDNENEGDFQGDIDNDATGTGFINITNSGNTFNGTITNQNTGTISITNDKTFNSTITNTGDKSTGDYNIKITNNKELTGSIENKGTGSIYIGNTKDTGRITGKITNNNAGTIILNNDGEIASAILNGGAGAINIANNGTLNGSITNTGDKGTDDNIQIKNNKDGFINGDITNSGAGNINITNQDEAVLNSNINNDGSGSIIFTNNGDVDANVVNNNPSVRINDTSLRQIQNTGNGKITIINNKTLNRPISNTSGGIIDITNNSSMETDITNNTESSEGGITFKNKQEFKGKLINANSGSISATNTGTFTGVTTNSGSGILDLDNQGIWNNTGNSVLTKLENKTGTIIFPQVSEVNAGDKDQYHTITVNGNYTGGGLMRVNTVWNKDGTSYSDRVDIHGDVDGAATTVRTLNEKGIYGDVTLKEIPIHSAVVVHVAGKSSGNDFTGSAPTTNAGEAQLKKIDTTSGTDYAWTLTAQPKTPDPVVPVPPGPTVSDKPVLPAPPIKEVPIYAEPVSGYVQMPTADMELGFTTVGTLHERRGENQTYNITGSNNTALGDDQQQTWGRVLVKHLDKDGKKRLDTAGNQSVLQIGHDFILDENEKTGIRRHIGGYVAYGHNENDFRDEYRAKNGYIVDDHYTGKGRTDAVSVGGYGTFYGNNGGYVDLVGQVTYLRNKYNARSNESVHQNGWGAALSAETGKSFIVYGNNWFVEPQAQLVYQYLSLDDFNDRIRHVDQHDPSALRGRVGMRFGYNGDIRDNLPPSSFYGIANIWHDFVNPKSVDIGRDSLKEEYAKTWGELGLGIQLPITRQSDFYSDIRYEKNFGSDKRKGFKGTMGYKYTWL